MGEFGTDRDGNVTLWRLEPSTHTLQRLFTLEHKWPNDVAFLLGMVATVGSDNLIKLWDIQDGAQCGQMFHDDEVVSCETSPDGRWLATASKDHTARVWSVATGEQQFLLRHQNMVGAVAFSPDGRYVASAGSDAARIWSAISGVECFTAAHGSGTPGDGSSGVLELTFSPDSSMLLTAGCDDCAILWATSSGRPLARMYHDIDIYDHDVTCCAFSRDGRWMLTGASRRMYLWKWETRSADQGVAPDG